MTLATPRVALSGYTTLRLGGPAGRFTEADTEQQVVAEVRAADRRGEPVLVLGGGSNLVVADEGFPGTVVRIMTRGVRLSADHGFVTVAAAAGEDWDEFSERCMADALTGVECLGGIPGLVGATPIQNVGAYGQEVAETIVSVRVYDRERGEVGELTAADCGFGYRTSMFKRSTGPEGFRRSTSPAGYLSPTDCSSPDGYLSPADHPGSAGYPSPAGHPSPTGRFVVLGVTFRLAASPLSQPVRYPELAAALGVAVGDRVPLAGARAAVLALRRRKGMVLDPGDPDTRSAGSFFTNPVISQAQLAAVEREARARFGPATEVPRFAAAGGLVKVPAAWLIERAGFTRGQGQPDGVRISAKHTLALVNGGQGSTASLVALAAQIRDGVSAAFGVRLTPEPVLVGVRL
jgi:UDP-N-acetylmuramate dehydrogenase